MIIFYTDFYTVCRGALYVCRGMLGVCRGVLQYVWVGCVLCVCLCVVLASLICSTFPCFPLFHHRARIHRRHVMFKKFLPFYPFNNEF